MRLTWLVWHGRAAWHGPEPGVAPVEFAYLHTPVLFFLPDLTRGAQREPTAAGRAP